MNVGNDCCCWLFGEIFFSAADMSRQSPAYRPNPNHNPNSNPISSFGRKAGGDCCVSLPPKSSARLENNNQDIGPGLVDA